jgi:hypothetical protein
VTNDFEKVSGKELNDLNSALKAKGLAPILAAPAKVAENGSDVRGGGIHGATADPDSVVGRAVLPANFRLLH